MHYMCYLGNNSPQLAPGRLTHHASISDDDIPFEANLRLADDASANGDSDPELLTIKRGPTPSRIPRNIGGEDTPASEEGMLPRDKQQRTAYYDYAAEKQMSLTDAKLIYQQSQLDLANATGSAGWSENASPIIRGRAISGFAGDGASLERTGSLRSLQSRGSQAQSSYVTTQSAYRPGLPTGIASFEKLPDAADVQSSVTNVPDQYAVQDPFLKADAIARGHSKHPGLPHEHKPLLTNEGIHGAGAGVGLGSGVGGFTDNDANITSELSEIYTNVQRVLDLRHKYIRLSLQGARVNPKDEPNWIIYPPPPEPVWDEERERSGMSGGNSMAESCLPNGEQQTGSDKRPGSSTVDDTQTPRAPRKKRKPGQDIGEDFDMADMMPLPEPGEMIFKLDENSVFQVYENSKTAELEMTPIVSVPTIREFYMDLDLILNVSSDGPSKSFAFRRLQYLEGKFNLYVLLNEYQEMADTKRVPHRDFYNVRKVDTHVHHSACMNQKHLLRFIKSKMKKFPKDNVMFRDGKHLTLEEVFQSINLTAYDLSIDTLDMHVSELTMALSW
jgi:AMP deaminase